MQPCGQVVEQFSQIAMVRDRLGDFEESLLGARRHNPVPGEPFLRQISGIATRIAPGEWQSLNRVTRAIYRQKYYDAEITFSIDKPPKASHNYAASA